MPEHIRALIAILSIATFVLFYIKKAIGPMLLPKEFNRWRNAWFVITLLAFLSSNYWLFIILSLLFLLYIAKSEQNNLPLYFLLLIIIPPISVNIPGLINVDYTQVLMLAILLPFFLSFKASLDVPGYGKSTAEKLMFAYLILSTVLQLRGTSFTDTLRYGFYSFTDVFLPYFAASRAIKDFEQLKKVMIALVFSSLIAGAIGLFELTRSWLLYSTTLPNALHINWSMGSYLARDNNIRAIASLGHPIILGYIMMVALGFYLFIAPSIKRKTHRIAGFSLIFAGLISALSRGPWVGTAIFLLIFIAFGQNVIKRFALLLIAITFALPVLPWIPGGEKVINLIPFVGETDKENVEYRQELIDSSILIIKKYPLFGAYDPKKEPEMEKMVQGEGIVDLVNTYLVITLYNGIAGLSLFLGFFSLVLLTIFKKIRKVSNKNSEEYRCGRILLATLTAVLVTIFTVSSIGIVSNVYWLIAGLIFSYVRVTNPARVTKTDKILADKPVYPTSRLKNNSQ